MSPEEHLKRAENELQQASHAPVHRKELYVRAAQTHAAIAQAQIDLAHIELIKRALEAEQREGS